MPVLVPVESLFILDGLVSCGSCHGPMAPVCGTPVPPVVRDRHYSCRAGCERFTVDADHAERYALDGALRRLSTSDDAPYIPGWTPPSYDDGRKHVARRWNAASAGEQRDVLRHLIRAVVVGTETGTAAAEVPLSVAFHRRAD
ncbi:hypothetical protein [Actinocatenispora rupis]|uniref:Uncharacterized protein n=1 Tax=Actinocatenispora rupis TaxID=519421 RepID=A0A8J3JB87_9ACTN|nr:hypothetical protein [Actinocatenispora rupis]GID15242.1 hypothetical protein Aru02nite_61310 [Actinocatenispora rupis]